MPMRVALYARISKDRIGAGIGVDRQERLCRKRAAERDWEIVDVFTDNDLSAYTGKPRPGYIAMLEGLKANRYDAVLCWHTDRLHRSHVELEPYIDICQPRKIPTHAVEAGSLDLTTAWGRKEARNRAVDARYESEHMSERVKEGLAERADSGRAGGHPRAFAFERDGNTIRLAEAEPLAKGIREVLVTGNVSAVSRRWNAEGLKPVSAARWNPALVRNVMMRARNAGLLMHRGKVLREAIWEPIVTEAEWRQLVRMMNDRDKRPAPNTSLKWQGSSLYLCGRCDDGTTMRSNSVWSKNRKVLTPAYRCRAVGHCSILAVQTDELVNRVVADVLRKRAPHLLHVTVDRDEVLQLNSKLAATEDRRKQLPGLFSSGAIDASEWTTARGELKTAEDRMRARLAELASTTTLVGIADAPDPGAAFLASSVERRRAVLAETAVVTVLASLGGPSPLGEIDPRRVRVVPLAKK